MNNALDVAIPIFCRNLCLHPDPKRGRCRALRILGQSDLRILKSMQEMAMSRA